MHEPSTKKGEIVSKWGIKAFNLLMGIKGRHAKKKRLTILTYADYKLQGLPTTQIFDLPFCGSAQSHYGTWLKEGDYFAAFHHLIGTEEEPGLATKRLTERREKEAAEQIATAVAELERAGRKLQILAGKAADRLEQALDASKPLLDVDGRPVKDASGREVQLPLWGIRQRALDSVLDRNPQTVKAGRDNQQTTIIMPAYDPEELSNEELTRHLKMLGRTALVIATGEPVQELNELEEEE